MNEQRKEGSINGTTRRRQLGKSWIKKVDEILKKSEKF